MLANALLLAAVSIGASGVEAVHASGDAEVDVTGEGADVRRDAPGDALAPNLHARPLASPADGLGLAGIVSITPGRILDTRNGIGAPMGAVGENERIDVGVLGSYGVPATGVDAVVMNVTVTEPGAPSSFVTVWPTGTEMPNASSLNMVAGQTIANLVVAKVGEGGRVSLLNRFGSTHLIADVVGYSTVPEHLRSLVPARILDTRSGNGAPAARVGLSAHVDVVVAGRGGVPASGVGSVIVNVTVAEPSAESYVTVWPTGEAQPEASSLNMSAGETRPNLVVAKVGADGKISLFNRFGSTHLIADVVAWMPLRGAYTAINPVRVLDTRSGIGFYGTAVFNDVIGRNILRPGVLTGALGEGGTFSVGVESVLGVPYDATALVLNVTAVDATRPTYITAWPSGEPMPNASSINVEPRDVAPNLVVVERGGADEWMNGLEFFNLYNAFGRVHLIADLVGYFVPWNESDAPDVEDSTIHVVVAAPADVPLGIDDAGALHTVMVAEQWLQGQKGRGLRLDTEQSVPEVSRVQLAQTQAELQARVDEFGSNTALFDEITAAGFVSPQKKYVVFLEGLSLGGHAAGVAESLGPRALVRASPASVNTAVTWTSSFLPSTVLHELFHTFGAVSLCAPHYGPSGLFTPGHVSDPNDLMFYTSPDPSLITIDAGSDDYWGQGDGSCNGQPYPDLSLSPFLD